MLSELQTKHDYYLPVNLVNDIDNAEVEKIILNEEQPDFGYGQVLPLEKAGFYELIILYAGDREGSDTILFTLNTSERENAEWGIGVWVPQGFGTINLSGSEEIEVISPAHFLNEINIPFIFFAREGEALIQTYSEASHTKSGEEFYIKRGVGSVNIDGAFVDDIMEFDIGGMIIQHSISEKSGFDLELSGEVTGSMEIPANSSVRITNDVHFADNASLNIGAGSLIAIDEGVNVYNEGPVVVAGTKENPVLITCSEKNKFWGGFISTGINGTIEASYTIFCQSGYHDSQDYNWGHAQRQALFYTENSTLSLENCYMTDHIGQIFYPLNSTLHLTNILVQRAKTGGQLNHSVATVNNSIFTDFPDDSPVYRDEDNDALYIHASNVTIDHSLFMFAKDDGLDSGGNLGGTVTVNDSRFEACFHEGAALSSKDEVSKTHTFNNCIFTNCGQGLELGFSSPNHLVIANGCEFLNNYIGIRYGDNYSWAVVEGKMEILNSYSLYNGKDVWNMVRQEWSPKLSNMSFENTVISSYTSQYPGLEVINQ
jgi:hypothetical protein